MSTLTRSPEQIGNTIRRARKKLGMSQSELGKKAGLRQETISLIENGNPASKIETILGVLSALGLEFHVNPRVSQGLINTAYGIENRASKSAKDVTDQSDISHGLLGVGINEPE